MSENTNLHIRIPRKAYLTMNDENRLNYDLHGIVTLKEAGSFNFHISEYESDFKAGKSLSKYNRVKWIWSVVDNPAFPEGHFHKDSYNNFVEEGVSSRLVKSNDRYTSASLFTFSFPKVLEGKGMLYLEAYIDDGNTLPQGKTPYGIFITSPGKPDIISAEWKDEQGNKLNKTQVQFKSTVFLHVYTQGLYQYPLKLELEYQTSIKDGTIRPTFSSRNFEQIVSYSQEEQAPEKTVQSAIGIGSSKVYVVQKTVYKVHIDEFWRHQAGMNPNELLILTPKLISLLSLERFLDRKEEKLSFDTLSVHRDGTLITDSEETTYNKPVTVSDPENKAADGKTGIKVNLNIFFDGTTNNRNNVDVRLKSPQDKNYRKNKDDAQSSYNQSWSNVAIMQYYLDKNDIGDDKVISIYIEGIGTENNQTDEQLGAGFGAGETGIPYRAAKAFDLIKKEYNRILENLDATQYVKEAEVNVGGFSRGAAAARHFISQMGKLPSILQIPKENIVLEFTGIFDTVSSYENAANTLEGALGKLGGDLYAALTQDEMDTIFGDDVQQLGLKIGDKAHQVLHIVAENEHRNNFSLTDIRSSIAAGKGYELQLPGVHSDIGGGYIERETQIIKLSEASSADQKLYQFLTQQGYFTPRQVTHRWEMEDKKQLLTRTLTNHYQFIALAIMTDFFSSFGRVYFRNEKMNKIYALPEDLKPLKDRWLLEAKKNQKAGTYALNFTNEKEKAAVRNKYIHLSANNDKRTMSPGMQGRYENGKPRRLIIPG